MIRKATEQDIPRIVDLLKLSLGEDLLPKSEVFWRWKHIQNPFGESPVLLQEEEGRIVGVRAFMQWHWTKEGKVYRALRAVDTATHPDFQGKGIFKKLTLGLVDESIKTGFDFIFNTPNSSSKPGYLKMGWEELGKPSIRIRPTLGMALTRAGLVKKELNAERLTIYQAADAFQHAEKLNRLIAAKQKIDNAYLKTDISTAYLKWRYSTIPVHQYGCLHDLEERGSYCIFFRPKQTNFGIEGRITDILIDMDKFSVRDFRKKFKLFRSHFDFITVTETDPEVKQSLNRLLFLPSIKAGPVVTTRNLNLENPEFLLNFASWKPALGDLELF